MAFLREPGSGRDETRPHFESTILAVATIVCVLGILVVLVMAIAAMLRWSGMPVQQPQRQAFPVERLAQLVRLP